MTKRTGKRQSPLERKATQHQDFVGSAEADRAESLFREHERIEQDRMDHDGAVGPEIPFRIPRSIEEGKKILREAPEALREKARERLASLPLPAQKAAHVAESAAQVMLVPLRIGLSLARELWRLPAQMMRVFRAAPAGPEGRRSAEA